MSLKRTMYRFGGKDYEHNQFVEFTFNVERVSIQNFLAIEIPGGEIRDRVIKIGEYFNDTMHKYVDGLMKPITVKCWPETLFKILCKLGLNERSSIDYLYLDVRNRELRAVQHITGSNWPYRFQCFDPANKTWKITQNTPLKIEKQKIINGKLWRRLF